MPPSIETVNASKTVATQKTQRSKAGANNTDALGNIQLSNTAHYVPQPTQNILASARASLAKSALHPPVPSISTHGICGANIAPKYAKIQPAIAIKPKPIAPSIAAGSKSKKGAVQSSFDPRYNPGSSPTLSKLNDSATNINTSREWVLPPRPRPGRRPVAPSEAFIEGVPKQTGKKKSKVSTRGTGPSSVSLSPSTSPNTCGKPYKRNNVVSSQAVASGTERAPSKHVLELQRVYLSKLKEQELVQNYIDILMNQIKELKFVQSGVITFDALHSSSLVKPKATTPAVPADQLDHINNVRDLEAFLAHLTTQSNVIHSVTKKFIGDSPKESSNNRSHLSSQIRYHLGIKAKHKKKDTLGQTKYDILDSKMSSSPDIKLALQHSSDTAASELDEIQPAVSPQVSTPGSFFTSDFFRPLDINFLNPENRIMDVDIINQRDPFSGSMEAAQDKQNDSSNERVAGFSNVSPEAKKTT